MMLFSLWRVRISLKGIKRDSKALYLVNGKSTLERCIEQLDNYNFENVILTIGYQSTNFFNILRYLNQEISN